MEKDVPDEGVHTTPLPELAALFLRLGATAFGGPAAHIAMMEEEVVRRRRWISHAEFLDLLGATNLIPGPNSTEMAIHIGFLRAGWKGLIVAGACFIGPAFLMVLGLAWAYERFGRLPQVAGGLYGVKPVIIAVVFQALWGLSRAALKTRGLLAMGLAVFALSLLGANELALLFGGGVLVMGRSWLVMERKPRISRRWMLALFLAGLALTLPAVFFRPEAARVGDLPVFLYFLKVGSVLYGSGYVLLAFLRSDLVTRWHWLTNAQLLDATAIGQVTPGPVFTTATFIGYLLGGFRGAVLATVGIFLPAFVFVGLSGPWVPRLRQSPLAGAFLDGVNAAALALMAVVTLQLARAALVDPLTITLALASALFLIRFRWNSFWLILGGAGIGWLVNFHPL